MIDSKSQLSAFGCLRLPSAAGHPYGPLYPGGLSATRQVEELAEGAAGREGAARVWGDEIGWVKKCWFLPSEEYKNGVEKAKKRWKRYERVVKIGGC